MKIFEGSNSQAGQESFVLNCLNEKTNGFYIEIGSNDPFAWNNTYLLETKYGWSGVAFEIQQSLVDSYNNNRKNKCIQADATKFDYLNYFKENNVPQRIDYLQLDIEPASQTLAAMYALPFNEYRFSVITFEHDLYADKNNLLIKSESAEFLKRNGYRLAVENVNDGIEERIFEDWWIDPVVVNYDS
jgi:hypothetical protein